jgi:hypothetical protein
LSRAFGRRSSIKFTPNEEQAPYDAAPRPSGRDMKNAALT